VKQLCENKPKGRTKFIVLSDTECVGSAMDILATNNLLSLPVVSEEKKEFYGFVDVLDIAGFILARWKKVSVSLERTHFPTEPIFNADIMDVINYSNINSPLYIKETDTVEDAIKLFCAPKTFYRVHRVAVQNQNGKVINVLSQSDLIYFASQNKHLFPAELVNLKIGMLTGLIRTPIMVRIDAPFSDALETLFSNRISGLALVDHEFKLCGNFSASDLRGMNAFGFDFFNGSTLQFLIKGTSAQPKRPESVQTEDTFGEVLSLLERSKLHRVYITDNFAHPIGFISLIDLIVRFP